jgi:hypothetical protein
MSDFWSIFAETSVFELTDVVVTSIFGFTDVVVTLAFGSIEVVEVSSYQT